MLTRSASRLTLLFVALCIAGAPMAQAGLAHLGTTRAAEGHLLDAAIHVPCVQGCPHADGADCGALAEAPEARCDDCTTCQGCTATSAALPPWCPATELSAVAPEPGRPPQPGSRTVTPEIRPPISVSSS